MNIDINSMQELLVAGAFIVPIITGLIQVVRTATNNAIYERYLPIVSIVIGILLGGFVIAWSVVGVIAGVIFGLAASGFYDLGKKTVAGK